MSDASKLTQFYSNNTHAMFRGALLELTWASEQTAILASLVLGCRHSVGNKAGGKTRYQDRTVRSCLLRALVHAVDHSLIGGGKIAHIDPLYRWIKEFPEEDKSRETILDDDLLRLIMSTGLGQIPIEDNQTGIDLAIAPVEGIDPLVYGRQGGSTTFLALGPRGVFKTDLDLEEDKEDRPDDRGSNGERDLVGFTRYFIFVVREEIADRIDEVLESNTQTAQSERLCIDAETNNAKQSILDRMLSALVDNSVTRGGQEASTGNNHPVMLGTTGCQKWMACRVPGTNVCVREFVGSPTSAAIAVADPRLTLNGYFGVVRSNSAYLIAAAARCLPLRLYALPVACHRRSNGRSEGKVKRNLSIEYDSTASMLKTDDFVDPDKPVGLIATAITPHPAMHGVRYPTSTHIRTESMVLNGSAKTVRRIRHDRDLDSDFFTSINDAGTQQNTSEVITSFLESLGN